MWFIIVTGVPVALALYGLSRLQHIRSSHGAQSPTCSTYTHVQFSNHENPDLRRQANALQSAEERDAEVHKYLVKWDSGEESGQGFALLPSIDVSIAGNSVVGQTKQTSKHKGKQADVKWDAFEEK